MTSQLTNWTDVDDEQSLVKVEVKITSFSTQISTLSFFGPNTHHQPSISAVDTVTVNSQ